MNKERIQDLKNIKELKGCIYCYVLKDKNDNVFYIGIGSGRRVFDHFAPSALTKNTLNSKKMKSIIERGEKYYYEILCYFSERSAAENYEKYLINSFGRIDEGTGCLCNHTAGGDAVTKLAGESRRRFLITSRKNDQKRIGIKRPDVSKKLKEAWKYRDRTVSQEVRDKISKTLTGNIIPDEVRKKISKSNTGKIRTKEHCENLGKSNSKVPIICLDTGEVFFNLRLAEEWLKSIGFERADRRVVHSSIKKKQRHCGYRFDYYLETT